MFQNVAVKFNIGILNIISLWLIFVNFDLMIYNT